MSRRSVPGASPALGADPAGRRGTWRLLRPFLLQHWRTLAGAMLLTVTMTAASLATPWPLKLAIDHITERAGSGSFTLTRDDWLMLVGVVTLVLVIAAVDAASSYYSEYWLNRAGERIVHALRVATYAQLQRLSLAFHSRRQKGDLVTRVTGDVNAVGYLFAETLGTLVSAVLMLGGMFVVCVVLDPLLALAVFVLTPPLYLVIRYYQGAVKEAARRQRMKEGEIASLATEALAAMPVVKAFGTERFEHDRVQRSSEERLLVGVEAVRLEARFGGLVDMIGALSTALILGLGVVSVAAGRITPGTLVVFAAYSVKLYKPLRDVARQSTRLARTMARLERIGEILHCDEVLEERGHYAGEDAGDDAGNDAGGRRETWPAVTSGSNGSPSVTAPTGGRFATSTCTCPPAGGWPSSGRPVRASPPSAPWWPASTTRPPAGSPSTGGTRGTALCRGCAGRSACCCRRPSSSAGPWPRTSRTDDRCLRPEWRRPQHGPARRSSSPSCRRVTTPPSARVGWVCPEVSVNASASPGCCCATRPSSCSTSPPPAWTPRASVVSWTASSR